MRAIRRRQYICIVLDNVEVEIEVQVEKEEDDRTDHLHVQSIKGKLLMIISLICFQSTNLDQSSTQQKELAHIRATRTRSKAIIQTEIPKPKPRSCRKVNKM
jgi:hypothetical protein